MKKWGGEGENWEKICIFAEKRSYMVKEQNLQGTPEVEEKYPRYLSNHPQGEDLYEGKSQERLADALVMHITETDQVEEPIYARLIGLEGKWGSGKSNVIKILEDKDRVTQVVCMLQKEVAERLASPPGGRDYGILSVLLQTWYDIEYLFTVDESAFVPPPKVKSGVIRLWRNTRESLECDWDVYKNIIKTTFGQRRKTLRNSIRQIVSPEIISQYEEGAPLLDKRPEQLGVEDFINLSLIAEKNKSI